eukprot:CAMPEP_0170279626 /NCGR_PEP_ID=MMETSP0116_2-20130129/39824_1 /TAXON_ID=400756 /ORGANISM="Durinskia baltica, Strain CSIRO CS-38" /LENGTH=69 /DNA_ID=CAMNT_0010530951 /DNA_START=106 /DNA_END=313 /DNA_ORIENTATION=+
MSAYCGRLRIYQAVSVDTDGRRGLQGIYMQEAEALRRSAVQRLEVHVLGVARGVPIVPGRGGEGRLRAV